MAFDGIVEIQLAAMLERIQQDLGDSRDVLLSQARRQARARLRDARRRARQRMALAIAEERSQGQESLGRARAALASRLRRKQQLLDREQLKAGQRQLRAALHSRWEDSDARREWAVTLLQEARALLPSGKWCVEHPDDLDPVEAESLLAGTDIMLRASKEIDAGFRLVCGDACLDMSVEGLLARSEDIAGELLAEELASPGLQGVDVDHRRVVAACAQHRQDQE